MRALTLLGFLPLLALLPSVIGAMDESSYKNLAVSRGFNYHYYTSPAQSGKPTVFFVHGFGIGSKDWRNQVDFFAGKGYGIVAPDMLGYAGSAVANGVDPSTLKYSLLAKDVLEIMKAEKLNKTIFVGQGGGSPIISRIAQLYPDQVQGAAFLSVPYYPPNPTFDYTKELAREKQAYGHELLGFMDFYANDAAVIKLVANHFDAFFTITYPEDPKSWSTMFGPLGELRKYIVSGTVLPFPTWFPSANDAQFQYDNLKNQGRKDPFAYYKAIISGLQAEDDKAVPLNRYNITKPVFFGAALDDYVSLPNEAKALTQRYCKNAVIHDFKANHWVHLQVPGQVNDELLKWIQGL
ncbi:hypothetical protein V5O48_015243 [Marasmius crinis-equi]|uniref:AB hydrolase-1 domain-containing protein n=1 Tax=Marasmius crinis-equi TaxID=585013 RepID=A0ABR3EV27_9AGAR